MNNTTLINTTQAIKDFSALETTDQKSYQKIKGLEIKKMNGKITDNQDKKLLELYQDKKIVPLKGQWYLNDFLPVRVVSINEAKEKQEKEFNFVIDTIKNIPNHLNNLKK